MSKDEALKIASDMLSKIMHSDNNVDAMECVAFIKTAEANKDYGKIYSALEDTRKFIVKLQEALKQK